MHRDVGDSWCVPFLTGRQNEFHPFPSSTHSKHSTVQLYLQYVFLPSGSRQTSNTKVSLLRAPPYTDAVAGLQHVAVQLSYGFSNYSSWAIFGIRKAAVLPAEVHHQPELPERSNGAEQGDQDVLVRVPWDLADEDFTARSWRGTFPHWPWNRGNGMADYAILKFKLMRCKMYNKCLVHFTKQVRDMWASRAFLVSAGNKIKLTFKAIKDFHI